jgi:hypothetical protein
MFKVKNLANGKFIKDAITRVTLTYASLEEAEQAAASMTVLFYVNGKNRAKYVAVQV